MARRSSRPQMPRAGAGGPGRLKAWSCGACDFIYHGSGPPDACPECGGTGRDFLRTSLDHD